MNSISRLIVPATVAGLFVWLFADALFRSGMFAFRDAAHYYYPLFELIRDQWAAGRVPLWNPYENLGQPLAGDATASVFYPGKLIFALPLDYAWAYKIYIMAHVLLAAATAYRLARHFGASVAAGGVCAISYAFSGNVLFQYCNVVFLVGAAWLPLAMLAADRTLVERSLRRAVLFGLVLALMVLGGDPQMAYHAGLLAAMYALWLWWCESSVSIWQRVVGCVQRTTGRKRHHGQTSSASLSVRCTHPTSRPALLALAAVLGLTLSAVQVLPSMEFARRSGRHTGRSIDGLFGKQLDPGTHGEHVYHFSVGPWRLAEYVWPNVGGRQFPVHRRWFDVVPAEGRIWTPSLYMGLLPLLLALAAMRFRARRPKRSPPPLGEIRDRWLCWSVVLAVVASFGWYGLGWLIEEIRFAAGGDAAAPELVAAPLGGLYWLMTLLLPGYTYFRYPAKLLVVAALGLSLLAARGFDRTLSEPSVRFRRGLLWLGGLSLAGAIGALAIRPVWAGWLCGVQPDALFGPLDTTAAANDLLAAFLQTAVLCGVFWWLLGKKGQTPFSSLGGNETPTCRETTKETTKGSDPFSPRWVPAIVLVLVAVDLAVANRWMIVCAPAGQWKEPSKLAAVVQRDQTGGNPLKKGPGNVRGQSPFSSQQRVGGATLAVTKKGTVPAGAVPLPPYRVFRHPIWMPPRWSRQGSPDRLAEAMRWDRDTLWPKYHLASRVTVAEVYGAMMPLDYEVFLWSARQGRWTFAPQTDDGKAARKIITSSVLPYSLAKYVILPGDQVLPSAEPIEVSDVADVSLWRNPGPLPRAWIVHQVDVLEPLDTTDLDDLRRRTREVLFPQDRPRDLRVSAAVESAVGPDLVLRPQADPLHGRDAGRPRLPSVESCRVAYYDPVRVEIEAELSRPGLVVLCDQFYPGWRLDVRTLSSRAEESGRNSLSSLRSVPILRTNRVMRGVWLPAGRHRLIYRYRPASFVWGAIVSGLGWIGLVIWGAKPFVVTAFMRFLRGSTR